MKINDEFLKKSLSVVKIEPELLQDLKNRWNEPHRHFHNIDHLNDLFSQIETISSVFELSEKEIQELSLIALFHDIVYVPLSPTNEEDSVQLFEEISKRPKKYNDSSHQTITLSIMTTKFHKKANHKISNIFNSLDMNIVFRDIHSLWVWESKIRKEFHMVPDREYKRERLKFLYSLLQDPDYMGNFKNLHELVQMVERKYNV